MKMARATVGFIAAVAGLGAGCGSGNGSEKVGSSSAAVTVCAGSTTLEGVDVSDYQGTINWADVKSSGRAFAIARVSDGSGTPDTTFAANWPAMKSAGLVRGVYQYFRASDSPTAQATLVTNAIGSLGAGDLPPIADIETLDGETGATLVANLATWVSAITTATGRTPIIYTAEGFWDALPNTSQFANVTLWVANWGVTCPDTPTPWTAWSLWQYNDNGTVSGIAGAVDIDKFNGTLAQLQTLAAGGDGGTGTGTGGDSGAGSPAGSWGASYVAQSFPLATTTLTMTAGQTIPSYIELKNIGTKAWDTNTRLGTTQPRDRTSAFADSTWLSPDRPAGVTGTVPTGGTYKFTFDLHAPDMPGTYTEYFGVLEEGAAWFSDPGQDGPPDTDLEVQIQVVAAEGGAPDAGMAPVPSDGGTVIPTGADADVGTTPDGGTAHAGSGTGGTVVDAGVETASDGGSRGASAAADGGFAGESGGCSVTTGGRGVGWEGLFIGALVILRRRRREPAAA